MTKGMTPIRALRPAKVGNVQIAPSGAPLRADERGPFLIDTTENLIRQGHLVAPSEFQALMGWTSPQSASRALAAHRIFAMEIEGQRYFPTFFAHAIYNRRHLAAVTKQLGDLPGGAKLQFFGSRKGSLSGWTPLEALAAGRLKMVLQLASAYAEA